MTVGIVFFDVDGTLVGPGSSSSFLAARFGHQDALDDAELRYADGDLTNQQVSEVDALGWRGTTTATIDRWLDDLPVLPGTETVVAWCRAHDVEPVLASLAWQPVTRSLARRFGFVPNGGPRVGEHGGAHDGTVAEHFDEFDKRDRALALARDLGVPLGHCCAIGDSRSDIPLFQALPSALALNAGPAARAAASDAIDADDLSRIIPWLDRWLRELA
ncbi:MULTISPECIES: haloacid dehalogenase-like hydrolase [unclassified Curtobacterium]|uniref:HAD family hydrolase n=1 Tax=unclassified Curtobacterium TaxID=257496 RepID=UPI000D92BD75|nr:MULTISPECIES: haloacid dehalogenase-like hydrolase [unclassified Curtobacterium]PYY60756.1 haloacid dehalogenase [Curtobacterium sp. MCPF17_003]PZF26068.1 haloacid dehalogenase [Curtobacterium sp. MCPF17_051]WIB71968.1 haloacid dehalogenase-like hydrolase [Curtobacterium sp. MCBD17_026]